MVDIYRCSAYATCIHDNCRCKILHEVKTPCHGGYRCWKDATATCILVNGDGYMNLSDKIITELTCLNVLRNSHIEIIEGLLEYIDKLHNTDSSYLDEY